MSLRVLARPFSVISLVLPSLLLQACGGGGSAGNSSTPSSKPEAVPTSTPAAAPVAVVLAPQSVLTGQTVTLDGSGSSTSGTSKAYRWTLSVPPGSAARLSASDSVKPVFTPDIAGTYVASLTLNDGKTDSAPAVATVFASVVNLPPVAKAGPNQSVVAGSVVSLDGSGSSDPNGDSLRYDWLLVSRPAGSAAVLSSTADPKPTFVADKAGAYQISLAVFDGKVYSSSSTITVNVGIANVAPVANAGPAQSVKAGTVVTLDGSASSDANSDPLTYRWTLSTRPAGSAAVLSSATSARPSFLADVIGTYVAALQVSDGKLTSEVATVPVTAALANAAPIANAGTAQSVRTGSTVTLNGSASSDADGDPLTYQWTLTSKPSGSTASLSASNSPTPSFVADQLGTYVASLQVNDGKVSSNWATVPVTASTVNAVPIANAGRPQSVITGTVVTLDGTGSTDADGDTLSFQWNLTSRPDGSTAGITNPSSAKPTFLADVLGTYVASLVVNDGKANSAASTVPITAGVANVPPVASGGPAQNVIVGSTVKLDGSASTDANGDALSYRWTLLSKPVGSAAVLSSLTAMQPTFVADVFGVYVATLVVNDGKVDSPLVSVVISATTLNAVPVANPGSAQTVVHGTAVTLDAAGSTDANGDPLTYQWQLTSRPAGSTAALLGATTIHATFTPDVVGVYVATLVVNDGKANSAVATVPITAN